MESNTNSSTKGSGDNEAREQGPGTAQLQDLELFQWGPCWGLPSIDPFCLKIHAYLNFVGLKYKVTNSNNPAISPAGVLPVLRIGADTRVGDSNRIIDALSERNYYLDYTLTPAQLSERDSYISLIEDRLYNFMLYNWYAEENNFAVIRIPYHNMYVFPLGYYYTKQLQKEAMARLNTLKITNGEQVYREAARCYQALATRLGGNKFFFGDKPSSVDATLYGHLACQLAAELPVSPLSSLIKQHGVLVSYCNRIAGLLKEANFAFDKSKSFAPHQYTTETPRPSHRPETEEDKQFNRRSLMFVAGALGTMACYVGSQHIHFITPESEDKDQDDVD